MQKLEMAMTLLVEKRRQCRALFQLQQKNPIHCPHSARVQLRLPQKRHMTGPCHAYLWFLVSTMYLLPVCAHASQHRAERKGKSIVESSHCKSRSKSLVIFWCCWYVHREERWVLSNPLSFRCQCQNSVHRKHQAFDDLPAEASFPNTGTHTWTQVFLSCPYPVPLDRQSTKLP